MEYIDFLKSKIELAKDSGFDIDEKEINPILKPHQRDTVKWNIKGGKRANFMSFGMGKTVIQLETCRIIIEHIGGKALLVMPLGIKQEFKHDAVHLLGMQEPVYCRNMEEVKATDSQFIMTNYERVRDGDIDPTYFTVTSLDEASVLRSFGSKTYQTFLNKFKDVPYKFVSTATPSPNKYKELIHYAGYLEILDTGAALTRFFQRDSTKANNLTIYPHKEKEFYLWLSSWALFVNKPSDLGYDDTGYDLPPLQVNYHKLSVDNKTAGADKFGQFKLAREASVSLKDAAREKRESIDARIAKMVEIVNASPDDNFILWHDLEAERHAIKKALPKTVEIYGSQDIDVREQRVVDFSNGKIQYFATKKELSGSGCNFQKHCHRAIFIGIDYEFNDFFQAIHRIYRFLQTEQVIIDIIYMESESQILKALLKKWEQHDILTEQMTKIIKENGLANVSTMDKLARSIGVDRVKIQGEHYTAVNNDCILETAEMESNSIDLIHTSIPFGNHYEYANSYNDFGHNEDTERFFEQMDFLSPNLLRILKPGRVFACHVKDRVLFGNATGTGMPTMEPFHADCIKHYMKHGFQYFGMITVVTDVVRENNQTYRLGWTEQCKDGSKMGVGCPEYILLFRKLPTDTSTAYADEPVVKSKEDYTRGQWQIDAHGFWRTSGNRLLTKEELKTVPVNKLQKVYTEFSKNSIYNYEEHIALAKDLDEDNKLPASFMVVAPASWNDDVWTDINRMRTLNADQKRRNLQMHVCLAKGSLVLTRNGYKEIQNINIGDMVLTHNGNWKPVIAKKCTGINPVVRTVAQGVANLITTPTHKLYVKKPKGSHAVQKIEGTNAEWVEAKDTVGGYVNLKLPQIEESSLTATEWWVVGRYLADGHMGTRKDFHISVGKNKESEFIEKAHEYIGTKAVHEAIQYRLKNISNPLKDMLSKCGRGALNKQVPIEGLCLNKELSESLLQGYLSGDGHKTGNSIQASSISRPLLLGLAMVAQRARNVIPSIFKGKSAGKYNICGREVDTKQDWVMSWRENGKHTFSKIFSDGAWKKVRKSIRLEETETWSIQVEDDASYTAEGCIVKNCPLQLEIVDRIINRYSNVGDTVLDPFAGIFTVPSRAIKLGRKGYGIELNSDYFRDGVGYCKAEESKIDMPTLFDFME